MIPRKVIGKFSVRIVPNQTPELVEKIVIDYLEKKWRERESPNAMKAFMFTGGRCWVSDTEHPNYLAGRRATKASSATIPMEQNSVGRGFDSRRVLSFFSSSIISNES